MYVPTFKCELCGQEKASTVTNGDTLTGFFAPCQCDPQKLEAKQREETERRRIKRSNPKRRTR